MKKVLFLITKSNWGGAQRYVYDLATGLPKDEFETVVAVGGDGPLKEKLETAGIRVISISSLQRDISWAKELRSFAHLTKLLRTERPDILHINSSKAGILGALAGRLTGVPKIIFTTHGWAFNEDRPTWQKFILKKIHWLTVLLTHQTIAVSKEVKRQMNWPLVQHKMAVVYNGRKAISLLSRDEAREFFIESEPRLALYKNDFWSCTIAELHPIKRHSAIIESIKEVVKKMPQTRHLIIGGGEENKYLHSLVSVLGLEEHVFLLGEIDEASRYLRAADVFIMASRSEAMPYAPIEACISGLPTISTSVGGIPEIIEHEKNGLLTPPLDNRALLQAILRLRTDSSLLAKLSKGASETAEKFTFSKTLAETLDIYRD